MLNKTCILLVCFVSLSTVFFSCTKERVNCHLTVYERFIPPTDFLQYPEFNPTDNNIIALTGLSNYLGLQAFLYNINSGTTQLVDLNFSGAQVTVKFDWGTNGKLLFNRGFSAFSTNPDGSNIEIFPANSSVAIIWSPDCTKILAGSKTNEFQTTPPLNGNIRIYTLADSSLKQAQLPYIKEYEWGANELIAVAYNDKFLNIYDTLLNLKSTFRIIPDDFLYSYPFSMKWIGNTNKIIWTSVNGIFITDAISGQTELFKQSAKQQVYKGISVSNDGSKIVVYTEQWQNCASTSNACSLIDLNTGAETKLNVSAQ